MQNICMYFLQGDPFKLRNLIFLRTVFMKKKSLRHQLFYFEKQRIIQNKAEQYHNGWDWTGSDGITSVKIRRDRIGLNWTESDRIGLKPIELGPAGSNKIEKSRKR